MLLQKIIFGSLSPRIHQLLQSFNLNWFVLGDVIFIIPLQGPIPITFWEQSFGPSDQFEQISQSSALLFL